MRVALVTNIPSPYRLPVWDSLGQKVNSLQVFLCSETEPNRIWRSEPLDGHSFSHSQPKGLHFFIAKLDWSIHFNPTLWRELESYRPTHILLSSYEMPSYLIALLYAKIKHIPVTLWWESHAMSSRFQRGPIAWLKQCLIRQFDSFCAVSHLSKEFLIRNLKIPEEKIVRAVNTVDVQRWHKLIKLERQGERDIAQPVRFLFVGQFIERKGIFELLSAFGRIPTNRAVLKVVGHGPLEKKIRSYVTEHRMTNVEIIGPTKTIEETAIHYAWGDILIMPSLSEVWGLVINEALACGLYVMSSKYAAATLDLVERAPCDVGVSIDPLDAQSLVHALESVIDKRVQIDHQAITAWGQHYTPDMYAASLLKAMQYAGEKSRQRP